MKTEINSSELLTLFNISSNIDKLKLLEDIGDGIVDPGLVLSLVSRLVLSELNNNMYPKLLTGNDFKRIIEENNFKNKLNEFIGNESNSCSGLLFKKAFDLMLYKNDFGLPKILLRTIIKESPDLFLMLLQWLRLNEKEINSDERKGILATITVLSWFGQDNVKYVKESWENLSKPTFWTKGFVSRPFYQKNELLIYPLVSPDLLRSHLIGSVVNVNDKWPYYPKKESEIIRQYKKEIFNIENKAFDLANKIWRDFFDKLENCKSLILYAQREYISKCFGDYCTTEKIYQEHFRSWDWDNILPSKWLYYNFGLSSNTKLWDRSIGSYRALSIFERKVDNDTVCPKARLEDNMEQSFVKENDWLFWSQIEKTFVEEDTEMIKIHLSATVHRLCNIYEEWYSSLSVSKLFGSE